MSSPRSCFGEPDRINWFLVSQGSMSAGTAFEFAESALEAPSATPKSKHNPVVGSTLRRDLFWGSLLAPLRRSRDYPSGVSFIKAAPFDGPLSLSRGSFGFDRADQPDTPHTQPERLAFLGRSLPRSGLGAHPIEVAGGFFGHPPAAHVTNPASIASYHCPAFHGC